MKNINRFNWLVVCMPILILATYPIYKESVFAFALLSMILTGLVQIVFSIIMLIDEPKNKFLLLYIVGVLFYFLSIYFVGTSIEDKQLVFIFYFVFACMLAIYLSLIINFKHKANNSFLTAEWNDLAIINFEIDAAILSKYLPIGTEIDFWNGKCFISLIGFMFEDVRVLGLKIPFHTDFEEVNLRFYVKRFEDGIWKRGVVFIKEIVPKHAITIVANTLYKEHYETLKMRHQRSQISNQKSFRYEWLKNKKWHSMSISTAIEQQEIVMNSEAEFITEHYFGYTKFNKKTTIEYEVTHPRWLQLQVMDYEIDVNFEDIYGKDFTFLNDLRPTSAFLAIGSKITIEGKTTIKQIIK